LNAIFHFFCLKRSPTLKKTIHTVWCNIRLKAHSLNPGILTKKQLFVVCLVAFQKPFYMYYNLKKSYLVTHGFYCQITCQKGTKNEKSFFHFLSDWLGVQAVSKFSKTSIQNVHKKRNFSQNRHSFCPFFYQLNILALTRHFFSVITNERLK